MNNQKYAVVDLEATVDEQKSQKHIIQIGMTFVEHGKIVDTITIDIKPPVSIQPSITELTGITNDMVDYAPMFEDIAEYLQSILEGNIFVAHNVLFDYVLLQEEFARIGMTTLNLKTLDTLELAQMIYPNEDSYSLSALCTTFNISLEHHHNAGCDAHATAQLLLKIIDDCALFPLKLQSICHYILQAKNDSYAAFFRGDNAFSIEDWLQQYDMTTQKAITQSVAISNDAVNSNARLILTNRSLENLEHFSPYIIIDTKNTTLKNKRDFIAFNQLEYWLHHVNRLTIQEVRQLVKICIWINQTNHKDIANLSIIPKLKHKLVNNDYTVEYQHYLTHLDLSKNMITTLQTFDDIQQQERFKHLFKNHTIILNDINSVNEQVIDTHSYTLPLSDYIWKCFNIKQQWRLDGIWFEYVFELEKCIKTFFSCIQHLRKHYPNIQQKQDNLHVGEVENVYLSATVDFSKKVLHVLKQNVINLIDLLEKTNNEQASYFNYQLDKIDTISHCAFLNTYVYVTLKKLDMAMGYTLHFKPFNSTHWITQLKTKVKQIAVLYNGDLNNEIERYATWLFGKFDECDRVSVNEQKRLVFSSIVDNISRAKDNLIVKKLEAFTKKQRFKTVIVLPSQKMVEKVRSNEPEALILESVNAKKIWYKLGEDATTLYMTWQQFVQVDIPVDIEYVMLLKLPFDPPGSVYEHAVCQLEKNKLYFSTIQLPKVIVQLKSVFEKISEQTQIVVCDERLIYSSYSEKILTILGENYTIITQTVENLLKQ